MNKTILLIAVLVIMLLGGATYFSNAYASSIVFENKKGAVSFSHELHYTRALCSACHLTDPPEKFEVDKTFAHKTCKGCHKSLTGPTKCNECHVKD